MKLPWTKPWYMGYIDFPDGISQLAFVMSPTRIVILDKVTGKIEVYQTAPGTTEVLNKLLVTIDVEH